MPDPESGVLPITPRGTKGRCLCGIGWGCRPRRDLVLIHSDNRKLNVYGGQDRCRNVVTLVDDNSKWKLKSLF